jgi:hypothetical protein
MIHPIHNLIKVNQLDNFEKLKSFLEQKFNWSINEAGNLYLIKVNKNKLDTLLENSLLGTIFEKETNRVIFYGLNNYTSREKLEGKDYAIEELIDGTQINLWWYNGWKLSTNSKIDAFNSKWGCEKSFGELFEEIVNINKLDLNQHYCYSFILQHIENRIVSPILENKVWHIESRNLITGEPEYIELGLEHPKLVYLEEFLDDYIDRLLIDNHSKYEIFSGVENRRLDLGEICKTLERLVGELDYSFPGYVINTIDRQNRYVVKNSKYEIVLEMRQISPNWEYIIIDLIKNRVDPIELVEYYPEKRLLWCQIETDLLLMRYAIYDLYYRIKVEKEYYNLEQYLKAIIYNIHKIYLDRVKKGENYKITIDTIGEYFSQLDTPILVSMYKKYKENPFLVYRD